MNEDLMATSLGFEGSRVSKELLGALGKEGCFWSPGFKGGVVSRGRPPNLSHQGAGCQV